MAKRLGAWLIVLVLYLSLCLTGCGKEESHASGEKEGDRPSLSAVVRKKERYLRNGELSEALAVLYGYVDEVGMTEEAEEAIADYFEEVTFRVTVQPGDCDKTHCFTDTTYDDGVARDIGLQLVYPEADVTETVARVTIRYAEDWQPQDDDVDVVGHDGDRFLFYLYSGPGRSSSFLYTIHTNKLKIFEVGSEWEIVDDLIIGSSTAYAVGDEISLHAYSWDGELIYGKNALLAGFVIKDGWLYYARQEIGNTATVYTVHKMKCDGSQDTKLCTVTLSSNSFLYVDEDMVEWWDDGKEGRMPLSKLHDVTQAKPTTTTQSWQEQNAQTDALIAQTLAYMRATDEYRYVYKLEFYSNMDGIISCYIKESVDSYGAHFGVDINRKTKEVQVYNMSGRCNDSFYLP